MEVEPLDPRDRRAFAEWFAVLEAAELFDRPGEHDSLVEEVHRSTLDGLGPDPDTRFELLAARVDGAVVGIARLVLPQRDNRHMVELDLAVHPAARRRGTGRALLDEVGRRVRELGRTTVAGIADEPPGAEGRSPGRLACQRLGYDVVQEEVRRDLDLPLDPDRVAELERTCRPYARDYELRTWVGRCPDDLVDDRAELSRVMSTDVPLDRLDWHEEVWDAARVRRQEALARGMDRLVVNAGAVHVPSGRLVAYTQQAVPRSRPERGFQWDTLVRSEHRGRRLGTLLKLASLAELGALSPATRYVSTWNAQENTAMIAVNDALGARTNGRIASLQKVLT
jgi:GNAT superfamily N-acetyltransferase